MKRGIIQIFFSNFIFLFFGVLNNFILPKFLSVDTYAVIKTYMLYIGYAGFLGFGFMEGMFLKYGGKTLYETKKRGFGSNFLSYLILELVVSVLIGIVGVFSHKGLIVLGALGVVATNIVNYFKNYTTAVAEYKLYSEINSFEKIAIFLLNVILVFGVKSDNPYTYIFVIIMVSFFESFYMIFRLYFIDRQLFKGNFQIYEIKSSVSIGIALLCANGISALFIGIDQWFVKWLMNNYFFALYAFAASLERIIALFITPITTVLYNFFCKKKNTDSVLFLQEALVIWSYFILLVIFPLKYVIVRWIPNYVEAIEIIAILFLGQSFTCIINGIYINVMKAEKKQKYFLFQMIIMTMLSVILNVFFAMLKKSLFSIALATLLTKVVWLVWCEIKCKRYRFSVKVNGVMFAWSVLFLLASFIDDGAIGFIIYCTCLIGLALVFLNKTCLHVVREMKGIIKK